MVVGVILFVVVFLKFSTMFGILVGFLKDFF